MSKKRFRFAFLMVVAILSISLFASACRSANGNADVKTTLPTATLPPEPTHAPDRAILVPAGESNPEAVLEAETMVSQLAAASGLEYEVRETLNSSEITPDMRVVIFLNKPENLGSLAANGPGTQFVAVTDEEWNPAGNVTIIRTHSDQTAFLAGYLSALVAPNYRVGALLSVEDPLFNQSFLNGAQYFCGTCVSVSYPLGEYPILSVQSSASPPSTWQAAADQVSQGTVNVLFVDKSAYSADLFNFLAQYNMALIGT